MAKNITPLRPLAHDPRMAEARDSAICSACCELEQIADALQSHIEKHDEAGDIIMLSRGMLMRVTALSEAICMSHDANDPADKQNEVFGIAYKVIYGTDLVQGDRHG